MKELKGKIQKVISSMNKMKKKHFLIILLILFKVSLIFNILLSYDFHIIYIFVIQIFLIFFIVIFFILIVIFHISKTLQEGD